MDTPEPQPQLPPAPVAPALPPPPRQPSRFVGFYDGLCNLLGSNYRNFTERVLQILVVAIPLLIASRLEATAVATILIWIILIQASLLAFDQIVRTFHQARRNEARTQANYIAVTIGFVLTFFLFRQPFLPELLKDYKPTWQTLGMFIGASAISGWLIWYLRMLTEYREFFHVLLLTLTMGVCWYSQTKAQSDTVELTTIFFLLASLARLAKDRLDAAKITELQLKKADEKTATNVA